MNTYFVQRGSRESLIHAEKAVMETSLWGGNAGVSAFGQLVYDEKALYVRLEAVEAHIRAENTEVSQEPCEDSCLEFFFSPVPGDRRYFNVEFNPNGLMFLGLATGIPDLVRLWPMEADLFAFSSEHTEGGWAITYEIPHEFIRRFFPSYEVKPGIAIRGNFYKCGDLTERPHFLAWNPFPEERHTFHDPDNFGEFCFV